MSAFPAAIVLPCPAPKSSAPLAAGSRSKSISSSGAPPPADLTARPATPLTREELYARYGADDGGIKLVRHTFEAAGLSVVRADAGTRTVRRRETEAAVEAAFPVRLLDYQHDDDRYRGRIGEVHLPAALAGIVEGVFGLDTRRVVKRRRGSRLVKSAKAVTAKKTPVVLPV